MIIKNVHVYKEDKTISFGDIVIENGIIVDRQAKEQEIFDWEECYAIPGFIDIHFHGAVGKDFCDGVHIHDAVVRATVQMFGDNRMVFISDSMRATRMEDGNSTRKRHCLCY